MSKRLTMALLVLAVAAGYATTSSARLPGQTSQGGGVKCWFAPVTQPDGTVVFQQFCGRMP